MIIIRVRRPWKFRILFILRTIKGGATEKGNWQTNSFNFDFIRIKAA